MRDDDVRSREVARMTIPTLIQFVYTVWGGEVGVGMETRLGILARCVRFGSVFARTWICV